MKNKVLYIIFLILFFLVIPNFVLAKDNNKIEELNIIVNPRNNGNLDIIYDIKWDILDMQDEKGLSWIYIPISNSNVDLIKALSDNIRSIKYDDEYGDNIRVDFKNNYYAGDRIEFKFAFRQSYMYLIEGDKCIYNFAPESFESISIKHMKVTWNSENIFNSNTKKRDLNGNLLWETSLRKGKKITCKIEYQKNNFNLDYDMQITNAQKKNRIYLEYPVDYFDIALKIIIVIVCLYIIYIFLGLDYKLHGGYGYRKYSYYDSIK